MTARRLEHGTPEGYDRGCTRHDRCPALPVHGLTCETAHIRFATGERRYMAGYDRRLPAAAIAQMLGLTPLRPSAPSADAEPMAIAGPADDVEAQIEAYAIAKAERDRAAAAASAKTPGGGAAVDEDNLGATGAPATAAPGPTPTPTATRAAEEAYANVFVDSATPTPTPAVCPECVAGKHGNCDGTAWDLVADEPTDCSCHHPENTPDHQEQTMPKRKTEPTSTPATKPQPPKGGFETFEKPKPGDGSGRTKAERAEIRAWAEANGIILGTAGRIPRAVIDEYDAAQATAETPAPAPASSPLTENAAARFTELAGAIAAVGEVYNDDNPTTVDETPADETTAEEAAPDEEVGEYDYAAASDAFDEVRTRMSSEDLSTGAVTDFVIPESHIIGQPERPDWATVTISEDVERARDIAARIEAENAILLEQLDTIGTALETALRSWAAADDKLAVERAQAAAASTIRRAANRHLLEKIQQLEIDLGAAVTELEIHRAAARIDRNRITELVNEVDRLSARRWWQIGGAR